MNSGDELISETRQMRVWDEREVAGERVQESYGLIYFLMRMRNFRPAAG